MHARYTVQITPQPDDYPGFLVTSADFPPLTSDGDTREDAVANARGALLATIETLIEMDQPVPPPGSAPGVEIDLGTLAAAKIILNNLRLQAGLNRAQLAQRLGTNPAAGYRILSVLHASRMDQIDRALAALGYRAEFVAMAA